MSTIQLIGADLTSYVFSSSESAEPGFPLDNLLTYYADDRYVSSLVDVNQWIAIDFGAASGSTKNILICDNMNFVSVMATGTILLQKSNDFSSWTTVRDISTDQSVSAFPFAETNARYWRIFYNGGLREAPYIGNIFLERAVVPQFNYGWPYLIENNIFTTDNKFMLNGMERGVLKYDGRILYHIDLPTQNEPFNQEFRAFYNKVQGKARPFYLIDSIGIQQFLRYVHLTTDLPNIAVEHFGLNKINTLEMKSQQVGLPIGGNQPKPIFLIDEQEEIIITVA